MMERAKMLELKRDGLTYKAIGDKAGISATSVWYHLQPTSAERDSVRRYFKELCADCTKPVGRGVIHHTGENNAPEFYNTVFNLELLCEPCHSMKHNRADDLRRDSSGSGVNWTLTNIPPDLIDHVKAAAAMERQPMREWVMDACRAKLDHRYERESAQSCENGGDRGDGRCLDLR